MLGEGKVNPGIVKIEPKKLIGMSLKMSLKNDRTPELWKKFMLRRNEIINPINNDLICMQIYDKNLNFNDFTPETIYEKWAVREVNEIIDVPYEMESFILDGGLYAVFDYKGLPSEFASTWIKIYKVWLPNSEYELDQRPHFDLLGAKYKNNDPDSEEEIWVPIKIKS
jgi:AraC family transcriptional regulator